MRHLTSREEKFVAGGLVITGSDGQNNSVVCNISSNNGTSESVNGGSANSINIAINGNSIAVKGNTVSAGTDTSRNWRWSWNWNSNFSRSFR